MTDLIKRDDVLAAIDAFKRDFEQSWKAQFSADIKALPAATDDAKDAEAYAEELKVKLAKAVEALQKIAAHPYSWRTLARAVLVELERK